MTTETAKPKVIIVDDDRDTREMLAVALDLEGFLVSQATNGLRLISTLQVDRPDLILMDVNMSWIDGFELCRAVRQNEQFRDIPLLFISARTARSDIQLGMSCGADGYFTKPLDFDALVGRMHQLLVRREAAHP